MEGTTTLTERNKSLDGVGQQPRKRGTTSYMKGNKKT
jgi:hypothetical protein